MRPHAQLRLEAEARASEAREVELVQRALQAERRTAEAMRAEAKAAEEAAAAERAARFAADSEARELQHEMERLEESLRCSDSVIGSDVCPTEACISHQLNRQRLPCDFRACRFGSHNADFDTSPKPGLPIAWCPFRYQHTAQAAEGILCTRGRRCAQGPSAAAASAAEGRAAGGGERHSGSGTGAGGRRQQAELRRDRPPGAAAANCHQASRRSQQDPGKGKLRVHINFFGKARPMEKVCRDSMETYTNV